MKCCIEMASLHCSLRKKLRLNLLLVVLLVMLVTCCSWGMRSWICLLCCSCCLFICSCCSFICSCCCFKIFFNSALSSLWISCWRMRASNIFPSCVVSFLLSISVGFFWIRLQVFCDDIDHFYICIPFHKHIETLLGCLRYHHL